MDIVPSPPPSDFRASIARTYDNVAHDREEMGEAGWRWPIAERFLARMRSEQLISLVEVGAGVGFTSRWFADQGIEVVATDLSPAQVALCRAKGLEAHTRDMYDLGFPAGRFDSLWAMNCVHHVPTADLPAVLKGFARVVRPGGLAYIGVWGGVDREGMPADDFYLPPRFFSFRSDETLRAMLEAAFDVETFETFTPKQDDDGLHMQSCVARVRRKGAARNRR